MTPFKAPARHALVEVCEVVVADVVADVAVADAFEVRELPQAASDSTATQIKVTIQR
jgi:hypothetical protein